MRFEPEDNDRYRKQYEPIGQGVCGLSVFAVLKQKNIIEVLIDYEIVFENTIYPGHMSLKDLKIMLKHYHTIYKLRRGYKQKVVMAKKAICMVQWIGREKGPYHGFNSWQEASRNRHIILIDQEKVYCNANGWFDRSELREYLKEGYITSYLQIF